jgi:hypothetical protein
MTRKTHITAVFVAAWSLWAVPVFCVAGIMGRHCPGDCASDCGEEQDCFLDPCRVVAVRAELRCDGENFDSPAMICPVVPAMTVSSPMVLSFDSNAHSPPELGALPYAPSDRPLLI